MNDFKEQIQFNEIARKLNREFQIANEEIITKAFIQDIGKSLRIYIKTGDHNPPHFHVESKQRDIDFRIRIDDLELYPRKRIVD